MIGLELKIERTKLGIRQYRLAQQLAVPPTTIWQIESGRRSVTPEEITRIHAAMRALAQQDVTAGHGGGTAPTQHLTEDAAPLLGDGDAAA